MSMRQATGRSVYGASIVLGVLAISEVIFLFIPKLRPLTELYDLVELFVERIDPGLKGIISNSPLTQASIAFALVWLAAWAALEAFSRAMDGVSVWSNISQDSCGTVRDGVRRFACTSSKWLFTIATAPLLILWALTQRFRHGQRIVTVGFITIDPATLVRYLKHMALGLALMLTLTVAIVGGTGDG